MGFLSWMFGRKQPKKRVLSQEELIKGYRIDFQGVVRDKYGVVVPQPDEQGEISDGRIYAYMSQVEEQKKLLEQEKNRYDSLGFQHKPVTGRTSSHSYDSGGYDSGSSSSSDGGGGGSD